MLRDMIAILEIKAAERAIRISVLLNRKKF